MATMMRWRRLCPPSDVSLLERLMRDNTLYQSNPDGHFDRRYVTKLLRNYRYVYHVHPPHPPPSFCLQPVQELIYAEPPSGPTLRSWKFPTSCSMKMSYRCVRTSGIARPTATGKAFQRRFVMKWSWAVVDNILYENYIKEFDNAFVCSLLHHIRVSLWYSTEWWARTRERPKVRLSST